jgi:hypothetical protein
MGTMPPRKHIVKPGDIFNRLTAIQPGQDKPTDNSPSLDKIIPSLGYVRGNVQVISQRANSIKRDATLAELELLVQNMRANAT